MRKNTIHLNNVAIYLIAFVLGILLMFPYVGKQECVKIESYLCTLSFASLGRNISYFVQFLIWFVPLFIIQIYWGISIYKDFCVASIYVFSRRNSRIRWVITEILRLYINVIIYIGVLYSTSFVFLSLTTATVKGPSVVIHAITTISILSLYSFDIILLINLLSFVFDSGIAFAVVESMNMIAIAIYLMSVDLKIEDTILFRLNHFYRMMVAPDVMFPDVFYSITYYLVPAILLVIIVSILVHRKQFLKNTYEGDL